MLIIGFDDISPYYFSFLEASNSILVQPWPGLELTRRTATQEEAINDKF